jgi:hypothetical protein
LHNGLHRHDGTCSQAHHSLGYTAEHDVLEACPPMRAHYNEVYLFIPRHRQNLLKRMADFNMQLQVVLRQFGRQELLQRDTTLFT